MAAVMTGYAEPGITTGKFVRRRLIDGYFWSTVAVGWEAYNASNIANYGIAATEITSSGIYTASDPDPTTAGSYIFFKAAGVSLVVGDLTTGLRWEDLVAGGVTGVTLANVDGVTYDDYMTALIAVLFGKTTRSGDDILFKKRDGTTTKVTVTYGTTDGERTGSVIS